MTWRPCHLLLATALTLQGALLLVLFQTSHVVEHFLTDRAQGSLSALFDSIPKSATLVEMREDGTPDMASARSVRAAKVAVGQFMLVKPGQQVCALGWVGVVWLGWDSTFVCV